MANKKIQATATLFLDTKDAQNDAKQFVNDLKQKLSEVETAADKMTVFKDMVAYIAQVDRALAALRKNNKDAFNSMFDGLDINLKQQLEGLFGVNGAQLGQVDVLREKLNTLTQKSSMDELREFASVIKDLYTSVGKTPPTLQFGDGHSQKAKVTYIQQLTDAVNGFATVWEDVNTTVSKGFGGNGSGGTGGLSKEIQEKIDKLKKQKEELQDVLNAINNPKKTKVSLSEDADEQLEQLKRLKQEFNNAKNAKETFEKSGLSKNELLANPEYLKSIAEYIKSAQKLQSAFTNSELTGKSLKWINRSGDGAEVNDESASVVDKFVNQHKEAVDKIKSYYADLVKDIDAQIKQLMSGSGAGGAGDPTKGTVSLYDKLKKSVEEYLEIRKQLNQIDKEKQPEENKRLTNRKSELIDEIQSLKNISEDDQDLLFDVFDEADSDGAKLNEIVEKFCNVLKIEIPNAAESASSATGSAFAKITQDATEASEAVQNVMYHLGNLLNGQGKPRDTFGDMAENLTSAAAGTRWEQYGFGALGGGLFGVSDPSTITQNPGASTFIQSIDLSKYNMYMADTEERATALIDFLSKLQKFSMKSAEPNYSGFDAQLQGVDINSLYDQAKLIFDQSELTKDQFEDFVDEMVEMLKLVGLAFDTQTGELSFTNLTKEIANSENISTRFMKMLGYHGVNVGGTSFDGLGQGSVLFDFDKVDIVGYFNTVQEAVEDYQKIINQIDGGNWVGSIEQLQQYARNIDSIINKLTEAKNVGKLSGESGVDETLNKLTQIRKNIDDILTGKDVSGDNPFVTITTGSKEASQAVSDAKVKVESFLAFADKMQHENLYGSAENNVDIGRYIERLETAKTELEALGAQGLITAEDLEKVNLAFAEATSHLESETSHYDSYYSGSSFDYYDDYKQEQSKNEDLENELARKEERIAELESDLRASDDALQETLGNKYALIAESRTLEIERAELLLQKQNLEYEDILALMQSYQNLQDKAKEAFDYGDEKAMRDMQDLAGQIYDRVVPQNLDDFTEPDRWFKAVGMSAEEGAQKLLEFRERLEAVHSAHDDLELSDSEDIGDLQRENSILQDKLDLLNEIVMAYGNNITQKDRNRYEELTDKEMESGLTSKEEDRLSDLSDKVYEADSALEELGNTYDKIILKLANGKNVEILPDDAGLRSLYKLADEGYGETYNGIDIEDVVFYRRQEQSVIQENNQALTEQLALEKQISEEKEKAKDKIDAFYKMTSKISSGTMSASFDDVEIGKYMARLEDARAELEEFNKDQLITAETMEEVNLAFKVAQTELSEAKLTNKLNDLQGYTSEENLRAAEKEAEALYDELINERDRADELAGDLAIAEDRIRTAEAKMHESEARADEYRNKSIADAQFESEIVQLELLQQKLLEVKAAVDAKTQAFEEEYVTVDGVVDAEIASLQSLITQLQEVTTQINLINDGFNGTNTNTSKIELKSAPITESSADEANITDEVERLNKLQTVLTEVKNAILAKTKAFVDEGDVVGQVVGKEVSALMKLAETVDSIIPKVDSLSTKMAGIGPVDFVAKNDSGTTESGTTAEDKFQTRVNAKKSAMTKYINDLKDVQYVTDATRDELVGLRDALDTVKTPKDLNDIIAKFEKLQTEISILKTSFEKTGLNDIQNIERSLLGSFNTLSIDQKRNLEPERDAVIKQLETYKNAVLNGQKIELQAIEDTVRALREKIEVYKQANKEAKNAEKVQKKNGNFGSTASINATAKYNSLIEKASSTQFANSSTIAAALMDYEEAYRRMIKTRDELRSKDFVDDSDKEEFKRLTTECNKASSALEKLIKNTMKLKGEAVNENPYLLGSDFKDDKDGRVSELTNFVQGIKGADLATLQFKDNWNEVVFAVDNGDGTFTQMTATFTAARNEIVALAGDTKKVQGKFESFIDGVKNRLQSLSQYFIATVGIYDVWNVIKQGINHVREIDTALTELKKVTNETDASYNKFLNDMAKTGSVIGATVKDLTTMAADWSRLGYSMEEAGKLAESTAILLNVSEFDDATEASEALISTMQAFQYTADESGRVVDILNEVGNNYAVSSDGIAIALQDSASALMEAGNNLEQSVALVAAANKVVQDPNSVGSALRTISLRLRGTSVEVLEEMGEETDGVVESVSKMQEKIMALTGVNILTDSGAYKETYQILYEIGQVWKDMDDIDQAALLELMAGKNRANTLAAILGNMEDLEGAYNDALKAEGSALKENQAYLDSIQGRIDLFNNSVQTMWMNFIDSEVIKFIVDLGTGLIKLVDNVGLLQIAFTGLLTYLNTSSKHKLDFASMLGLYDIENQKFSFGKNGLSGWLVDKFKKSQENIKIELSEMTGEQLRIDGFDDIAVDASRAQNSIAGLNNEIRITESLSGQLEWNLDQEPIAAQTEQYKSMFSVLSEIKGIKLELGDEKQVSKQLDDIAAAAMNGQEALVAQVSALSDSDVALKAYVASVKDGNYSLAGFKEFISQHNSGLKASGMAAKAAAVGHQLLNTALSMGVSLLVSGAISLIMKWTNAQKEAAEAAREAAVASEELRKQNKSLKDYKDQITELRTELDSNTLSESEAYDAREKLLTIQNELIDKFGLERDGINLVTGALKDQIAVIDALSQKDAQQWLNTNKSEYLDAIEYFYSDNKGSFLDPWYEGFGATRISNYAVPDEIKRIVDEFALTQANMDTWTDNLGFHNVDFNGSVEEVKTQVDDFIYFLNQQEERLNQEIGNAEISGDLGLADALRANLKSLQDYQRDIGNEYTNWFGENSSYAANKAVMEEAQYQTAMAKYLNQYMEILDTQNKLTEAQAKGNPEDIKTAIENYKDAINKAMSDADETWMDDYFNSFADGLAEQEFEIDVKLNEDGLQDELAEIIQAGGEKGLSALDDNQILDMVDRGLNTEGATDVSGQYTTEQISGLVALQSEADKAGIEITDLINILTNLGIISGRTVEDTIEPVKALVQTYSMIKTSVDEFNDIFSQTSEIVSDGTEITQEYKDALVALGVSEEELAECFDENNGLIVKNAAALRRLVAQKKQDKQATVQQAKSMSQLQYKNTVQQLQQVVKAMAVEVRASGLVSSAALKTSESLREQLTVLKQTIQQYALLEISLSDAANAYSEFEAAKERDAQLTYGDSMIEMLQTINEGFKTGQVGTEAFQYAVKVIVPESEYAHIDNIEQRMIAIHDYIDKNPLFADWFTIDEGEFSIAIDNINSFIDDAYAAGLFTSDSSGDFFLTEAIKNAQDPLKEFADQLGRAFNTEVTEGSVLAMLTELEKYDASWGNILTDLTTTPLDRAINDATIALEEAITAQEEFITSGGDLNSDEYRELEEAVYAARGALDASSQAAIDNAQAYTQIQAVLKGMTGEVKYTQEQADALVRSLGLINENGHIQIDTETGALILTQEQLDALNERLTGLTEPTILDVQLAYDEIDRQLQELNDYLSDPSNYNGTILTELNIANEGEAKAKVDELTADRDAIELVYNITTTSTDESGTFEKLTTWEANGVQITISGDASEFEATVNATNAVEMDGKTVPIDADPTEANASMDTVDNREMEDKKPGIYMQGVSVALNDIHSIGNALDTLPFIKDIYVNVHYRESGAVGVNGTAHVNGTAYSGGNWGAPRTEVALTGELGPEMVVRDGRWFTVGENGAEFTQIKKGDIIFNHKQTEDLLSKGYVTSRGKAYASGTIPNTTSGTAYYKTFGGYVGDDDVFENGSDNWMDPWSNSFSDAAGSLSDAADSMSDAADDTEQMVDFIEIKLEKIEAIIEKTTARIENFLDDTTSINSKDELYDELVKAEKEKAEVYLKAAQKYDVEAAEALSGVPQQYQEMARNGAIAIKDFIGEDQTEIAEKIEKYRDLASKADEAENGHLEAIAAISAHRVEQLEDIATDFENIISISQSHSDLLQAEMDFIEESGNRLSESYYEELKKHSQKQLDDMQNERVALQKILDDAVAAGDVIIGSDDWYSMLETIYEVDQGIVDCKTSLEEFQNAINDLYWDNFDKLITEIDNVNSELSNLYDLISDDDNIVDDMGNWTADGYTALGLLIQQMEVAQQKSKEYGDAISKLKQDYRDGLYSTDEYNEKLAELTDGQYAAIKSYEDAKDAIVDLNKTRVNAIKNGIEKEIDAYEELINKKKESLDADKDARDFERSVEESNKSIYDVERKIASLKGNTSSSAIAERRRLEEELRKLQQEREDLFYNESVENQQEALDKELKNFQDAKNKEIEDLEEYLKNQEKVLQDSFAIVQENTQQIAGKLIEITEDYGVTISDTVATPWIKGTNAIGTYEEQLNTSVSATTKNLETLKQQLEDLEAQADKTANSVINATHSNIVETNDGYQTSIKGYAKGSKSVEYDQWALIEELGDELQLVPNKSGRLAYIKKGTGILNNTLTERLMDLAIDPTSMLENSRPVVGAPGITTTNNTFTIDASIGTLLHVEHLDGSNPAEVTKLVDKAWEKKMQTLNNSIKKFTR